MHVNLALIQRDRLVRKPLSALRYGVANSSKIGTFYTSRVFYFPNVTATHYCHHFFSTTFVIHSALPNRDVATSSLRVQTSTPHSAPLREIPIMLIILYTNRFLPHEATAEATSLHKRTEDTEVVGYLLALLRYRWRGTVQALQELRAAAEWREGSDSY